MSKTAGYTPGKIAEELNMTPVLDKIQEYRINWLQHINSITENTKN